MKRIFALGFLLLLILSSFAQTPTERIYNESQELLSQSEKSWEKGQYEEAMALTRSAIEKLSHINNGMNSNYAMAKYEYGCQLLALKDVQAACEELQQAYDIFNASNSLIYSTACNILSRLVDAYEKADKLDQAIKYGELLIIKSRKVYHQNSQEYADALYLNAKLNLKAYNYAEARNYLNNYISITNNTNTFDPMSLHDVSAYEYAGVCAYQLGDFEDARTLYAKADSLYSMHEKFGKQRLRVLNRLTVTYMRLGNVDEYQRCLQLAASLAEEIGEDNTEARLQVAQNSAGLIINEEPESAAEIYDAIVTEYIRLGKENSADCALAKVNLGYCYSIMGDPETGLQLIGEGVQVFESLGIPNMELYYQSKMTQIMALQLVQDDTGIKHHSKILSDYIAQYLKQVFVSLTERERTKQWKVVEEWYNLVLPNLSIAHPDDDMLTLCYNCALQSRGVLLNSSTNIERIVKMSRDESIQALYHQMMLARKDNQTSIADDIEHRILKALPDHGNFMADMSINTDSIRQHLGDGEIAIEFMAVEHIEDNDTTYLALTMKRDYDTPHLTILCTNTELHNAIHGKAWYNLGQSLYDTFWRRLIKKEFKNVHRVFFAVDGALQNIPIEYCTIDERDNIFERYECYRLSSTREITKHRPHDYKPPTSSVLYGDINYKASYKELVMHNRMTESFEDFVRNLNAQTRADRIYAEDIEIAEADSVVVDSVLVDDDDNEYWELAEEETLNDNRSWDSVDTNASDTETDDAPEQNPTSTNRVTLKHHFDPLPGTRAEIDTIRSIMNEYGVANRMFDAAQATEESVRLISGTDISILHFATHGFYLTQHEKDYYNFLTSDADPLSDREKMSRSALIFAGANNIFSYDEIPYQLEDGFLTAYELSTLDFGHTDLVVMSACNSGLGDISSEGVFGLQRGFKMAGARSLMMSVSPVNDHATMLFMNEFYHSLMQQGNKIKALKDAQQKLRTAEHGRWDNPQYWGAFILLDAIQ